MQFPLSFWDIAVWLAVIAVILLTTAELISLYYGRANLAIEKRRLRQTALVVSVLFLAAVMIWLYRIIAY